ncbi:MAG TPA: hypothetical protein VHW00_13045 [Thermoanaerobaculia bacterium]|nr:hypothetical protein [Thermoanaerobaculia bacterium]
MFTAYFDESEAATVYFVSGWVATVEVWSEFTLAWNAVLASEPSIKYLRHNEAKGLKGEFAGWTDADVARKIDTLVDVICAHEMHGLNVGVRTTTWGEAFKSDVLSKKQVTSVLKFTHPYQACFHAAVAGVLQRQLEKGFSSEVVNFVFDEQKGLLRHSIDLFAQFKPTFPKQSLAIAGEIVSGDDKSTPALQAADLLCGQIATALASGKPDPAYQRLVTCHEVAKGTAYPPKFEQTDAMVKLLGAVWTEKKMLDSLLALMETDNSSPADASAKK